jgi:5-methylcytosine-specific restriction endonuclease McrA
MRTPDASSRNICKRHLRHFGFGRIAEGWIKSAKRKRFAELQRESYRRNYEKNYPRYLTNARNWRARKKLADGSHSSEEVQQMVRDQGCVCAYCEFPLNVSYHVDHMTPLSRGGRNDWTNLAITCGNCNLSKGSMTLEEVFAE